MSVKMENQFSDNELTQFAFKLDFGYFFDRTVQFNGETSTLISVIEEWLWEKHGIWFYVEFLYLNDYRTSIRGKNIGYEDVSASTPFRSKLNAIKYVMRNLFNGNI